MVHLVKFYQIFEVQTTVKLKKKLHLTWPGKGHCEITSKCEMICETLNIYLPNGANSSCLTLLIAGLRAPELYNAGKNRWPFMTQSLDLGIHPGLKLDGCISSYLYYGLEERNQIRKESGQKVLNISRLDVVWPISYGASFAHLVTKNTRSGRAADLWLHKRCSLRPNFSGKLSSRQFRSGLRIWVRRWPHSTFDTVF